MFWIVYCHTNRINGKRYVGYTKTSLDKRWRGHLKTVKAGSTLLFHNAIRKYGPDVWDHEIICEVTSLQDALEQERHHVKRLDSWGPNGYNMNAGGEGAGKGGIRKGWQHTTESRQKMSESHKGLRQSEETKRKRNEKLKGHTVSEATRKKLSEQRGWHHSEKTRAKLREAWKRRRARTS